MLSKFLGSTSVLAIAIGLLGMPLLAWSDIHPDEPPPRPKLYISEQDCAAQLDSIAPSRKGPTLVHSGERTVPRAAVKLMRPTYLDESEALKIQNTPNDQAETIISQLESRLSESESINHQVAKLYLTMLLKLRSTEDFAARINRGLLKRILHLEFGSQLRFATLPDIQRNAHLQLWSSEERRVSSSTAADFAIQAAILFPVELFNILIREQHNFKERLNADHKASANYYDWQSVLSYHLDTSPRGNLASALLWPAGLAIHGIEKNQLVEGVGPRSLLSLLALVATKSMLALDAKVQSRMFRPLMDYFASEWTKIEHSSYPDPVVKRFHAEFAREAFRYINVIEAQTTKEQ